MKNGNGHTDFLRPIRYLDLFCGIGGFRVAIEGLSGEFHMEPKCVLSSDIDEHCKTAYAANFQETPFGDIRNLKSADVPDHDLLFAGFPCQPFSIIGHMKGFADTRGTLFFEIARILETKHPVAFVLENVKLLAGHNGGRTLARIMETLRSLGYKADYRILNALKFGLPQKRERIFIVGFLNGTSFTWPDPNKSMKPLGEILEQKVDRRFYASDKIRKSRWSRLKPKDEPSIWHENKAGHISAYPFSCALRAGASYNYLLVNGERRLTSRELLRLQGFPEKYKIACNDNQTRKQAGNSVAVPVVKAVLRSVLKTMWHLSDDSVSTYGTGITNGQMALLEQTPPQYGTTKIKNGPKVSVRLPKKQVSKGFSGKLRP